MANKYRGQVPINLGDKQCILQFDLDAVSALHANLGEQASTRLISATSNCDTEALVIGVSIGLERNHPGEYSIERIKEILPPVALMQEAVYEAMIAAWHGPKGAPEENPPKRPRERIRMWIQLLRRKSRD